MQNNKYYFKHNNDIVAIAQIDLTTGAVRNAHIVNPELLPVGVCTEDSLKNWWQSRAVSRKQDGIGNVLQQFTLDSTQSLLLNNLGLSLTDHYWVCPVNTGLTWSDVSLYSNKFSEIIYSEDRKSVIDLSGKTLFSPASSVQGELRKKWVRSGNKIYLAKGNYNDNCQQSVNEVLATQMHKKQNEFPYVEYKLATMEWEGGTELGCISENFTSEEYEFVPACDVFRIERQKSGVSSYEHFISMCVKLGIDESVVRSFLEYQIITDFVITNTDRHLNNFGVVRNANTFEIVGMAPIFDSGNSMFWDLNFPRNDNKLLNVSVNSFASKELTLLKYIRDFGKVNVKSLLSEDEIFSVYTKTELEHDIVSRIVELYEKKIHYLALLQNGARISDLVTGVSSLNVF
ncbi:HipA domain-containing protein [Acetivibrio ethanolgignens]|uniref:HipA-like C-terminal domain-containing protein n=1 Tax=Acetivibrio ethanolgignens TaxID=290052 RepID=A0A0V8QDU6_9FIRM|nr:HipA domain-containing protein [Acetivibrio ethanolgignens]KSV58760.1 hypothetical protein ASU35_11900 [Acetivibrio ethanolgignens]